MRPEVVFGAQVLKLGLKFADWLIVGGNARTVAMLKAFMHVVRDYAPTADKGTEQLTGWWQGGGDRVMV